MKKPSRFYLVKCAIALFGILLVSFGVAFNQQAGLGNDAVGIFYDGIRAAFGLSGVQLGTAANIVNGSIVALLLIIGRRYINVGTFIYLLPYGLFVGLGTTLYQWLLGPEAAFLPRAIAVALGCVLLYFGVALFVAVDIGLDPMTGLTMVLSEVLHWQFRNAKILFDVLMTLVGFLLGGTFGGVTIIATLCAGPLIQFFAGHIAKWLAVLEKRLA